MAGAAASFDPAEARRQTGGDHHVLREVIQLFIDDNPKREADLRLALQRGDARLFERAAHTIKGSCVIFGAAAAREAAHRLEIMGRTGNFEGAAESLAQLSKETHRLTADFKSFLDVSRA